MQVTLPEALIDPSLFAADYAAARRKFISTAETAGAAIRSYDHPLAGPGGEALATDTAWLGPQDAETVLVLISATHGVE